MGSCGWALGCFFGIIKMYKKLSYKNYNDEIIEVTDQILRFTDNTFIPFDPANTDYQAYLKWLAEGNTPTPADERN